MRKIVQFFKESYAELKRVTWPSREDVIASTKVVLVSVFLISIALGFIDYLLFKGIEWIF